MTEEAAAAARPPSLFDAVTNKDHGTMVELYATHARNAILSFLSVRSRWSSAVLMSRSEGELKSEEKLDEYLSHLTYREANNQHRDTWPGSRQWGRPQYYDDDSSFHGMIHDLSELLQDEASYDKEHPLKKCRKQTSSDDRQVDRLSWESAAVLSNSRPSSSFVVYPTNRGGESEERNNNNNDDDEDNGPALFDGSVANATPPPLATTGSSGGGAGTALHLACALDSPLALAILLAMGADAGAPHTAFRRLMMHEAACCGSTQCLELLLDLGVKCTAEMGAVVEREQRGSLFFPGLLRYRGREETRFSGRQDTKRQSYLSFLPMLRYIMDLARQVKLDQLSEMEAARSVLARAKLSDATLITLAKSCTFSLEKDAPFAQHGYADGHGNTPLHWAGFKNEEECVSLLLKFNADPNARAHPSGWTPLHDAAYSNAADSVKLLLEAGAHVDARANSGATPLCFAAQEDASQAAEILLQHGADLGARCCGQSRGDGHHQLGHDLPGLAQNIHHQHGRFSGYTPLHYCAHYNAFHAARVLLAHSSSSRAMEIPDLSERLPIHVAVARGSSDVLRELLHGGARVDTGGRNAVASSYPPFRPAAAAPATAFPPSPLAVARSSLSSFVSTPPRPSHNNNSNNVITPVSSPILRSMIPSRPVMSSKPWNCLSQRSIDECRDLISQAEQSWTPGRHSLFTPADRRAVMELLRVGKRLEQTGTGIFLDLWPLVLSFCGRSWFEVPGSSSREETKEEESANEEPTHFLLDR